MQRPRSTFQSSPCLDWVFFTPRPLFDLFGFTEQSANYSKCQLGKEKTGAGSPSPDTSELRGEAEQKGRKWEVYNAGKEEEEATGGKKSSHYT